MKVIRYALAALLLALSFDASATRIYPLCYPQGGYDTTASLNSLAPASSFPCALAWTADNGEMVSDGSTWTPLVSPPVTIPLIYSNFDFQSGALTSILGTKGTYYQMTHAQTVESMIASANSLVCLTNPAIALLECGTSTTCASPTTIASVQVTGTGTVTPATISS